MDIIDYAMKMEQDGKAYYETHAAGTTDPDLKRILVLLAEEETRHYEYFKRLKANPKDISGGELLSGSQTLENVKNIFQSMAEKGESRPFGQDVVSAWTTALRTEEKSKAFYEEKASIEPDSRKKELLLKIAKEEHNHIHMVDSVLMYLKAPSTFADSAQFKNFRSLEGWG
nr:ferritin family protein [candidate division Zixibacteria bacterium]